MDICESKSVSVAVNLCKKLLLIVSKSLQLGITLPKFDILSIRPML